MATKKNNAKKGAPKKSRAAGPKKPKLSVVEKALQSLPSAASEFQKILDNKTGYTIL